MNNFVTSDYLKIIKILGLNIKPMSYSEIQEKIGLANSSFSRALNWLQNEDLSGKELKEAYFLQKNNYIEHIGKVKSKNGGFKLTEIGLDLFNSEFIRKHDIEYIEELIKDFKINRGIWDFISRNKKLFLKNYLRTTNYALEPWTIQIFEFFDDLNQFQFIQIQESIPGPENMKFYNLLEILSEILIHHPIWRKMITEKGFEVSPYKQEFIEIINSNTLLKEKLFIIDRGDFKFYMLKSDTFVKSIFPLIERYLKIYYWQEHSFYLSKENLIQTITDNVINDLYQDLGEYHDFINDFKLEISYFVKEILIENYISTGRPFKMPFNLMNNDLKELINFQLRRKLLSTDSDDIPPVLLNQGASKDLIKEKIDLLIDKYFKDKKNLKVKLHLLEIIVYNYSSELRSDFWFYENYKMNLVSFIEQLIVEGISSDYKYKEQFLILAFIFFNHKYHDYKKAIEINEALLDFLPTDEYLLENLLYLHFSIQDWDLEKIQSLIDNSIKLFPKNLLFAYSKIIIGLLNKNLNDNEKLNEKLKNLIKLTEDLTSIIKIIKFFINKLDSHSFNNINIIVLEVLNSLISTLELKYSYAAALERDGKVSKALEIYVSLIDHFPNNFLESKVLLIFLNNYRKFSKEEKKLKELIFLQKVHEFSNILMSRFEFDVNEGNVSEFEEKRELFLKDLRNQVKEVNQFIKKSECKTLPLKIKALILKALNREKNLESTLTKILNINSNNIWAINELGFLKFDQNKFDEGIKLFELVELIKKEINYNIPYLHIIGHSYLYEFHEFNFAELYKKAGKYNQAILIYKDYIIDLNKRLPLNTTAKTLTDDLILCYQKIGLNTNEIIQEILSLLEQIEHRISIKNQESEKSMFRDVSRNIQHDPDYIKNSLVQFLYDQKNYKLCLEYILKFDTESPNILENQLSSILSPFNINKLYLADCYLNLNDLANASNLFEQAFENFNEDIRYKSKVYTQLWFIRPVPNYLKTKEKEYYLNIIEKGLKRINNVLEKENILHELIFKTDVERSIGNICLIIQRRAKKDENLFKSFQGQLNSISTKDKNYYQLILACSYAITGYIDEMIKIINTQKFEEAFPIISTLLKILFYYYENDFENYNGLNIKFHQLVPNSTIPLLLNLHFLKYKMGISKINNITNLFKTVWKITHKKERIHGIEKHVFKYLKNNLIWYPFKWALGVERYIKNSKKIEVNQIFEILHYIEQKSYNQERELLDFMTRVLNADRKIPEFLNLLLILSNYNYPDTKFLIYKLLNPEIDKYGLNTYGEIAYEANKLDEFLPVLDDYRDKELKKYKENTFMSDSNIQWLEERYVSFLLTCFKHPDLDERILKSLKYLENLTDYPKEKLRYFKVLFDIRQGHYTDAELNAYQLIKWFKVNSELKWDTKYYNIWILSKLLSLLKENRELNLKDFFDNIEELLDFEKLKKDPIYFDVLILDSLKHELLAGNEIELLNFTEKLFVEIIKKINWQDNEYHDIILEKMYFNRELISSLSLKIINDLDKLIENINPTRITERKYYLYMIKATILNNNGNKKEAREILEMMFENLPDRFDYIRYGEINDYYLDLILIQ
ncbi:MAG: tetratricopeptide repeat protein [Promethearchaeota archaeon]